MALGADRSSISRLVVGHGGGLVTVGVVLGAITSWWATRYVQTLLFQIEARDTATMAGAAFVLAAVGLIAAWIPGAARIEDRSGRAVAG